MDQHYSARYVELYRHHWWWRVREQLVVDRLRRFSPGQGYGPILDVGCGDGLLLPVLRQFGEPEGLEPDAATGSDFAGPEVIHAQPFDDDFAPGKQYGLITLLDVIEHLEDDVDALRRVAGLLRPGGVAMITVPAFQALWTSHDALNHHYRRYRRAGLLELCERAGAPPVYSRYFFHALTAVKLAQRALESVVQRAPSAPRLPGALVNGAARAFFALETRCPGVPSLPFGSSLMVVCRKPP